jgi:hypothetical protein
MVVVNATSAKLVVTKSEDTTPYLSKSKFYVRIFPGIRIMKALE